MSSFATEKDMNRKADPQTTLREWLNAAIASSGRTAREVASGSGIPEANLSQMRSGARLISDRSVMRLSRYLGLEQPEAMYVEQKDRTLPVAAPIQAPNELSALRDEINELRRIVLNAVTRIDELDRRQRSEPERSRRHA